MADFQGTFVQDGRDLKAANDANGDGTPISYIEAAQGTTAPTRQDTAVETPYVPPRRFASPPGLAIGDSYQFDFVDGTNDAYDPQEFCVFSGGDVANGGGTLMFRFVLTAPITKPANTRARYPLVGQIAGEDLTTLDFAVTINSSAVGDWTETEAGKVERASQNEAERTGGHSNDEGLSVLRGWQQIEAWWGVLTKVRLRNKLGMATAQQARAGSGDGVMTSEITAEAIEAIAPNRVLVGSRLPLTSDGEDGDIWTRTDTGEGWTRGGGVWHPFRGLQAATFHASGAYPKPPGATRLVIKGLHAGGGHDGFAGGGGGGSFQLNYDQVGIDNLPASIPVTIGAGGPMDTPGGESAFNGIGGGAGGRRGAGSGSNRTGGNGGASGINGYAGGRGGDGDAQVISGLGYGGGGGSAGAGSNGNNGGSGLNNVDGEGGQSGLNGIGGQGGDGLRVANRESPGTGAGAGANDQDGGDGLVEITAYFE